MKATRPWTIVLAVVVAVAWAAPIHAEVHEFKLALQQSEEVPPCGAATGSGFAVVTLDDATGAVTVVGSYFGLSSNASASHIHGPAAIGGTASPIGTVSLSVTGGTAGTISGGGTMTSGQITDMLAGMQYVNLHTTSCGPGEIRGQIIDANTTVPASSDWAIIFMGVGLLAAGILVIRRRRVAAARIG